MDKLKLLFTFIIFGSLMFGCADLKEKPRGLLTPETYYSSQADIDAAVTAAYRPLLDAYRQAQIAIPAMGGDDMTTQAGGNKQDFRDFDQFAPSTNNIWLQVNIWNPFWEAIYNANNVINNYELLEETEARNAAGAQGYFIRGITYYLLVRIWGDLPIITDEPATGEEFRDPVSEIYAQIISDLQFAEANLPGEWPDEPGRATSWAAKAFLAKVYLNNAGWPLKDESKYAMAAAKAKEVLDGSPHTMLDNYSDLWKLSNANNSESIFAVQFCAECGAWSYGIWWSAYSLLPEAEEGGWDDWYSEVAYFNDFPDGPRKDATFHTTFILSNGTTIPWEESVRRHPYFAKYRDGGMNPGNPSQGKKATSWKQYLIRLSNVALIYAEAKNMSGGADAQAYEQINKIRRRAAGLPLDTPDPSVDLSGLSVEEFHDAIIEERKWEFGGEWERWYDMTRYEIVEEVAAQRDNTVELPIIGTVSKDNYYAPIPSNDMILNPNFVQNPCCD